MTDERLTPSFFLSEFIASETATRKRIDNTPNERQFANIRGLLAPGMQRVREVLGAPVRISSGFRSNALNVAIGGSIRSQHSLGLAADFAAPIFGDPIKICRKLIEHRQEVNFDQLILEFPDSPGGGWVHVSFGARPRGIVLTANHTSAGTTYSSGIAS